MAKTLLQRILGKTTSDGAPQPAFHLPGALHPGVRVLLIDSGDLTDLLFAMPFVEGLRRRHPDAQVGLLCDEPTSHLALSSGQFHDLIVYGKEQLEPKTQRADELGEALRKESWEIAILIGRHPDPGRERLAYASGAVLRVGRGHEHAYPQVNCELRAQPAGHHPYRLTTTWGRLLGVPLDDVPLQWPLAAEGRRQMAQLVHFNKPRKDQLLIGVDPGIGKEGTRIAPENLAFLVNHLASHMHCKTILLTADAERENLEALRGLLRSEQLELPRETLREMVLLLAQCDLLVSGNTDLFHFGVAVGVPSLGIFGEVDGENWVPERPSTFELLRPEAGERLSLTDVMEKVDRLLG